MSLDQDLRSVLQRESERHEPPFPDFDAVLAGGHARRRRQRVVGGAAGAVVAVVVSSVLAVGMSQRDSDRGGDPVERPSPAPSGEMQEGAPPTIPYCIKATTESPQEFLHVAGRDLPIWCAYRNFPQPRHHTYLWHHAGRTIVESLQGVHVVTAEGVVRISRIQHPGTRISSDGRYVAWLSAYGNPDVGDVMTVYDLREGKEVVAAYTPPESETSWTTIEAIDQLGRVFMISGGEQLWMYDIAGASWAQVQGIPESWAVQDHGLSYLTEEGFAIPVQEASASDPVGRSVEGRVTPDGRFVPEREVPIGLASWSLDRSRFLHLTAEGFWVQPSDDFDAKVVLGVTLPEADPGNILWDAQWESATRILLTFQSSNADTSKVVRCEVESGDCERLTGIAVPLSYWAHPGG